MASAEKDAPPASLDKLPSEILIEICKLLCDHCSLEKPATDLSNPHGIKTRPPVALHALSRTSRRLRSIARPILYHDVGGTVPFFEWFTSISSEPELAESVKKLDLGHVEPWEPSQVVHAIQVARDLNLGIHDDRDINYALEERFGLSLAISQAYDEVTMALCLNVETMLLAITDCNPGVKKLQHLTLCSYEADWFSIRNSAVRVILSAAPALQTLVLVGTEWLGHRYITPTFHPKDFAPALNNLTTLEFINAKIEYDWDGLDWDGSREYRAFAKVIEMTENLKHFRYLTCMEDDSKDHIPPAYILKALRPRSETIETTETIEISTDDMKGYGDQNTTYPDMMVDRLKLEHFSNLHTLRLDETSFCEHIDTDELDPEDPQWDCINDMLPSTIKHLTIGMDSDRLSVLMDLLWLGESAVGGNFPALESVHVVLLYGPDNESARPEVQKRAASVLRMLEHRFEGSGVRVSTDPEPIESGIESDYVREIVWEREDWDYVSSSDGVGG